ncbi:MAG: type II toxin-antitoxin system HicA family toxin [Candidatus Aenigmarchaeota archaeon]|nr:type II toxin-antitoxin system HicA family toxin [Candidatus Aenigmarchaeota archaeon]
MFYIGKLRPLPQHKVIQILRNNGFQEIRSGRHITFKKTGADGKVWTTWVPHHNEVTIFVIKYIIKQTGKPREEFE